MCLLLAVIQSVIDCARACVWLKPVSAACLVRWRLLCELLRVLSLIFISNLLHVCRLQSGIWQVRREHHYSLLYHWDCTKTHDVKSKIPPRDEVPPHWCQAQIPSSRCERTDTFVWGCRSLIAWFAKCKLFVTFDNWRCLRLSVCPSVRVLPHDWSVCCLRTS